MIKLAPLLDEYEQSHQHPVNVAVHWAAEPLAIFALMALAASIGFLTGSLLWPFTTVMLAYYCWLSLRVAAAFLPIVAVYVLLIGVIDSTFAVPTWKWAVPLFATCWFALLLGHKIEGRAPSVFQNPNLIFVGPAWLMRIVFRRLNLRDP